MGDFFNRFNPFKNNGADIPLEKSGFTASEWQSGKKPDVYLTASKLIKIAHEMGFKTRDSIGLEMRDRWNEIIRKARASGLNEAEVVELTEISNVIIDKLKVKTGTIPDDSE
jgi:hypothetical protein